MSESSVTKRDGKSNDDPDVSSAMSHLGGKYSAETMSESFVTKRNDKSNDNPNINNAGAKCSWQTHNSDRKSETVETVESEINDRKPNVKVEQDDNIVQTIGNPMMIPM